MTILLTNKGAAFGTLAEEARDTHYSVPFLKKIGVVTHTMLPIELRGFSWFARNHQQQIAQWRVMEVPDDCLSHFTGKSTFAPLPFAEVRELPMRERSE